MGKARNLRTVPCALPFLKGQLWGLSVAGVDARGELASLAALDSWWVPASEQPSAQQVTGRDELLSNNPVVKRLYDVRRPMTDPLNILQVRSHPHAPVHVPFVNTFLATFSTLLALACAVRGALCGCAEQAAWPGPAQV
jgi:hypothetical protein